MKANNFRKAKVGVIMMNKTIKTYGVVINLDYSHQSQFECKIIWDEIVKNMMNEGFHIDKRMFIMTTTQDKQYVCDKARQALNNLDEDVEVFNQHSFRYITDFFTVDMSDYVDLRLPSSNLGIILKESSQTNTYY